MAIPSLTQLRNMHAAYAKSFRSPRSLMSSVWDASIGWTKGNCPGFWKTPQSPFPFPWGRFLRTGTSPHSVTVDTVQELPWNSRY
eukprot:885140-Amphidinium_carterae.1